MVGISHQRTSYYSDIVSHATFGVDTIDARIDPVTVAVDSEILYANEPGTP